MFIQCIHTYMYACTNTPTQTHTSGSCSSATGNPRRVITSSRNASNTTNKLFHSAERACRVRLSISKAAEKPQQSRSKAAV